MLKFLLVKLILHFSFAHSLIACILYMVPFHVLRYFSSRHRYVYPGTNVIFIGAPNYRSFPHQAEKSLNIASCRFFKFHILIIEHIVNFLYFFLNKVCYRFDSFYNFFICIKRILKKIKPRDR